MLDNPLFNPGGYFTNQKAIEANMSSWIAIGEIINLSSDGEYQNNLIQRYDVLIHNMNNYTAKSCIPITSSLSGNGVGEYATYKVGDAVIVSCLYNNFGNVVILGSISLPGDMEELLGKDTKRTELRKLQNIDQSYAPQPLISPDRAQNPSANRVFINSTQMDKESYKNPDLLASSLDRISLVNEQGLPNGIEIDSGLGDKGSYFRGLEYKYINGSYYHIVVADKEDECAKATKVAKVALDLSNKLKKVGDSPRNSDSLITAKYRSEQYLKMHDIALEMAKSCNTKALAEKQATESVKAANTIVEGTKATSAYKPNENKVEIPNATPRTTLSREEVIKFINFDVWQGRLKPEQYDEAIRTQYLKYKLINQSTSANITPELIEKILADPNYKIYKDKNK